MGFVSVPHPFSDSCRPILEIQLQVCAWPRETAKHVDGPGHTFARRIKVTSLGTVEVETLLYTAPSTLLDGAEPETMLVA